MTRDADWVDVAAGVTEAERQREIDKARAAAKKRELEPNFFCHWCEHDVRADALFCDDDCRDDWHRDQAAKKRNGR